MPCGPCSASQGSMAPRVRPARGGREARDQGVARPRGVGGQGPEGGAGLVDLADALEGLVGAHPQHLAVALLLARVVEQVAAEDRRRGGRAP